MTSISFNDNEAGYLAWMAANPEGFVANIDKVHVSRHYPMLHRASCKTLHVREHYTTGVYYKVCGDTLADIMRWAAIATTHKLRHCKTCRPGAA